jgi:hypothetical protein
MRRKIAMETCPFCEGVGEVHDHAAMHRGLMDPPYALCPVCDGRGEIPEDEVEFIDPDMTLRDYSEEHEAAAWEAREDMRSDR